LLRCCSEHSRNNNECAVSIYTIGVGLYPILDLPNSATYIRNRENVPSGEKTTGKYQFFTTLKIVCCRYYS
jgi:hypothetical protein